MQYLPFPPKKYQIILADPPWNYDHNIVQNHYDCMKLKDIQNLPVRDISTDRCALFLWVVMPLLPEAFSVIKAWGFEYKTVGFVWVKRNRGKNYNFYFGNGGYTKANIELCLLAFQGKPMPVQDLTISQILDDRVMRHSQKPEKARINIVKLFGDLPRIELFARTKAEKWDAWGNEINHLCNSDGTYGQELKLPNQTIDLF